MQGGRVTAAIMGRVAYAAKAQLKREKVSACVVVRGGY